MAIPIVTRIALALSSTCSAAAWMFADHINAFMPR